MLKIGNLDLYVGTKEEYTAAKSKGMKIVCALNRAGGFVTHQSVVGWTGRGCDKNHPHYLFKETEEAIYLNMIDGEDPKYVNDAMIEPALNFIKNNLDQGYSVFIYCSLGESRSPSIALMYMLENNMINKENAVEEFKKQYYPAYSPKFGNLGYIQRRWL
ncbi:MULTISPECIES: dual specificity protein phosphatase family protein [unclassified Pseudoalteromonas]|uniref:dual specificity protein phosphatase family protein n=1 Tax=unclassified Pseudoalteromonas TaxID=194690 RepID=UPI001F473297|nr:MULTISPECIES: dual specificity protein phosphatase family protein [unclassified Pseudoalteromonas]MCF2829609.1 dual specificity protein phosphatase family protein [Pseudoalteromonas sp. OF5H-5]MCF2830865.1 dual specificity protein phosphatase family protein [Pseudoalteromonas sp. DL2-H6]MCF2927307.1 dual specificity protein phosphatase family protein [Pseudoalteromonas sp. DL2-H1]